MGNLCAKRLGEATTEINLSSLQPIMKVKEPILKNPDSRLISENNKSELPYFDSVIKDDVSSQQRSAEYQDVQATILLAERVIPLIQKVNEKKIISLEEEKFEAFLREFRPRNPMVEDRRIKFGAFEFEKRDDIGELKFEETVIEDANKRGTYYGFM